MRAPAAGQAAAFGRADGHVLRSVGSRERQMPESPPESQRSKSCTPDCSGIRHLDVEAVRHWIHGTAAVTTVTAIHRGRADRQLLLRGQLVPAVHRHIASIATAYRSS